MIPGNQVTLLKNGADFFPALLGAIDSAKRDIRIETYIFLNDQTGRLIGEALQRAAKRGVGVYVMIDGIGSHGTAAEFFEVMRASGVAAVFFRPARRWWNLDRSLLRRNHRKIALIDGELGFVGGINYLDDMTDSLSATHPRFDYAVMVKGPVLADIYQSVFKLWRVVAHTRFARNTKIARSPSVSPGAAGEMLTRFVERDNLRHRKNIEREYLAALAAARHTVLLVTPYFLPGHKLRRSLAAAAKRGVTVTLLLQGRADHPLLKLATGALYTSLLRAGVHIHEYERAMLHAKVATIDDRWATVGSSNLDPFSLFLNREANLVIVDAAFAKQLRESIEAEMVSNTIERKAGDWHQRSTWARLTTWFAYRFARAASGWVGFKGERRE